MNTAQAPIEIKIKENTYSISANTLRTVAEITFNLEAMEKDNWSREKERIERRVLDEVSSIVSSKFLAEYSDEVLKKIDIDEIVKRVKLNIIQNIAKS
tara:strand:- start:1160 stop:1453 length:294 start_codon:yes stop_codon:yes gene_type:complete